MKFRPLLAAKADLDKIRYPVLVSPKLDGIRCLIVDGVAVTRSLKPIRNSIIQRELSRPEWNGFDGEIITRTDGAVDDFNTIQSKVMGEHSQHDEWAFHVFDNYTFQGGFGERYTQVLNQTHFLRDSPLCALRHSKVLAREDLDLKVYDYELAGYEGTMVRDPLGRYKFGRSTVNEGILLKIKKWEDSEATVIGMIQLESNQNEAKINALGLTERSRHAENKVAQDTMGALSVEWNGHRFEIGVGFTEAMRQEFWDRRQELIGESITFKYQELSKYGIPRFPVFLGWRRDL